MRLNHFDKIAFIYDALASLVFGKKIKESQSHFLQKIPDHSIVLILGGGTGWILVELFKQKPNCEVFYIEASSKMIELAKRKINDSFPVHFIHGTEQDIPALVKFDVVITNFFLDMFPDSALKQVIEKIESSLSSTSIWIATDFVDNKKWMHSFLLKLMYWFFQLACKIEAKKLPDWNKAIQIRSRKKVSSKFFCVGFIEAAIYTA